MFIPKTLFRTFTSTVGTALPEAMKCRIDKMLQANPVVVFMKGDRTQPMCGFSSNVKLILEYHQVDYKEYDVLKDDDLREAIKKYSEWPTIPQVYVNKNLVGGCDILAEMHKKGEITDFFEKENIKTRFSNDGDQSDAS